MARRHAAAIQLPPWSWTACGVLLAPACVVGSLVVGPSIVGTGLLGCGIALAVVAIAAQVVGTWRLGGKFH